ncbi:hypothetical protein KC887_01530 [Candidatus Kaiserbacteria bacterium]|nr:hypothetical protein [Candidatus Kaiserbacteria bacterium]
MKKLLILLVVLVALAAVFLWWHYAESPTQEEVTDVPATQPATTTPATTEVSEQPPYMLTAVSVASSSYVDFVTSPELAVASSSYSCAVTSTSTPVLGETTERTINGKTVCRFYVADGAAGSVYHQYTYSTAAPTGELLVYTFTVREVQCMNYDEPQASECAAAQAAFDPDQVAAKLIMHTTRTP